MAVTLDKSSTPLDGSTVYAGGELTYTVTVTNDGAETTGQLTDALPAGLTQSTTTPPTCVLTPASAPQPSFCLGTDITLPAGGKLVYTVTATVNPLGAPSYTSSITNTATWTAKDTAHTTCTSNGVTNTNGTCSDSVSHTLSVKPVIGIAAAVQPANNVLPGGTVNYTVTVSNNDPAAAAAAVAAVAASNVSVLAPVQPLTNVTIPGSWTCVPTTPVDYCVSFAPDPNAPAGTLSGSFTVPLPYGTAVNFQAAGQAAFPLAQGTVVQLKAATTTAGPVHTCATGTALEADGSCSAIAEFTIATPELGIEITAAPNTALVPGTGTTVFTIKVSNPSGNALVLTDLGVQSLLPAGVTATGTPTCTVLDTPTPAAGDPTSTCPTALAMNGQALGSAQDGVLLPGGVYTMTVPAKVELAAGFASTLVVPASATTTNPLLAQSLQCTAPSTKLVSNDGCENKTSISTIGAPVISVSNGVNLGSTAPGGNVVFTMVAKNEATSGLAISDGTFSTDTLGSANITLLGWTCKHSDTSKACPIAAGNGAINQSGVALAVGEYLTYTVNALVGTGATVTDGLVIPVDAKFTASNATCLNSLDGTTTPCRKRAEVTVAFGASVLKITNVANLTTAAPGADVVFTIVATNTNGKPLADGVITTDTPANVTLGGWTCVASAGATCPAASGTGAINQSGAKIPVNGLLTYTLNGKLADTGLKDGDIVVLTASIKSAATASVTCEGGSAAPCTASAMIKVKIKVGAVTAVTPVPVDARWMLLALTLLLGVAAIRQQRKR